MDFRRLPSLSTIFKSTDLSPRTQRYLSRVYQALFACTATAGVTSYLQISGYLGTFLVPWSVFGSLACALAIAWTSGSDSGSSSDSSQVVSRENRRLGYLLGFGAFQGISLAPLLTLSMAVNPYLVMNSLICTALMFLCFSASALSSPRRSYLFMGSLLSSALSITFWLSIVHWFWPNLMGYSSSSLFGAAFFPGELALGLLIFSGYILFDTQVIVERAEMGVMDVPSDALNLFIDAVSLFIRILILLTDKEADRRRRRSDDEDERRNRRVR